MPHATESAALRAAFSQITRRKTGTRYPKPLRLRALVYCRARQSEGHPLTAIASELGLAVHTLRNWLAADTPESALEALPNTPHFHPVHIIESPPPHRKSAFLLRGPAGITIEGLDIESLAELLRRLG